MFKENFERICIEKNIAPTAVCRKIGLSAAAYSNWTEDTVPRKTTLIKIANELGVTVSDLIEEKKPTQKGERLEEFIKLYSSLSPELQESFLVQMRAMQKK